MVVSQFSYDAIWPYRTERAIRRHKLYLIYSQYVASALLDRAISKAFSDFVRNRKNFRFFRLGVHVRRDSWKTAIVT